MTFHPVWIKWKRVPPRCYIALLETCINRPSREKEKMNERKYLGMKLKMNRNEEEEERCAGTHVFSKVASLVGMLRNRLLSSSSSSGLLGRLFSYSSSASYTLTTAPERAKEEEGRVKHRGPEIFYGNMEPNIQKKMEGESVSWRGRGQKRPPKTPKKEKEKRGHQKTRREQVPMERVFGETRKQNGSFPLFFFFFHFYIWLLNWNTERVRSALTLLFAWWFYQKKKKKIYYVVRSQRLLDRRTSGVELVKNQTRSISVFNTHTKRTLGNAKRRETLKKEKGAPFEWQLHWFLERRDAHSIFFFLSCESFHTVQAFQARYTVWAQKTISSHYTNKGERDYITERSNICLFSLEELLFDFSSSF